MRRRRKRHRSRCHDPRCGGGGNAGRHQLRLLPARDPPAFAGGPGTEGRMIKTFPLFMTLQDRHALVVGGGEAAAGKVEMLLSAGAQVSLIAETVTGEIAQLIADGRIAWASRAFDEADFAGMS